MGSLYILLYVVSSTCMPVCVCSTGHRMHWILSTLARLTAPAGADLIQLVRTHWRKHLFGTKHTRTQTRIQRAHSLSEAHGRTGNSPCTSIYTPTLAHNAHRTCTHINSIWKWHWASVWTALAHSVFFLRNTGKSHALAMRSCSTAAVWPGDRAAVQLSASLIHTHTHFNIHPYTHFQPQTLQCIFSAVPSPWHHHSLFPSCP